MELGRREKKFSPKSINTPDGLTCRIDWEEKRRIRNIWMETKDMHYGTTAASACKEYTNSGIF
jgi:hypothetical protein